jgi:hypothetical protein
VVLIVATSPSEADLSLEAVLRFLGISASPSTQKGRSDEIETGDIWVADLERVTRHALTTGGGYRWPVFELSDKSVVALKGDQLVRIPITRGAKTQVLCSLSGVDKLVGFDRDNPDRLLVMRNQPESPLAVLSVTSEKLQDLPYDRNDKDQRRMLAHIRGEERVYARARVYVMTESAQSLEGTREWTDVYIQQGDGKAKNVSRCDGSDCGQPSLSPDGKTVVYIQSLRDH